jgi:hypothetical protein
MLGALASSSFPDPPFQPPFDAAKYEHGPMVASSNEEGDDTSAILYWHIDELAQRVYFGMAAKTAGFVAMGLNSIPEAHTRIPHTHTHTHTHKQTQHIHIQNIRRYAQAHTLRAPRA